MADSDRLEHQLEEAVTLRQDYESSASKLKTLEKQVKTLRQEKDEVHKVVFLTECCCLITHIKLVRNVSAGLIILWSTSISDIRIIVVVLCVLKFSSCVSSSWPTLWSV